MDDLVYALITAGTVLLGIVAAVLLVFYIINSLVYMKIFKFYGVSAGIGWVPIYRWIKFANCSTDGEPQGPFPPILFWLGPIILPVISGIVMMIPFAGPVIVYFLALLITYAQYTVYANFLCDSRGVYEPWLACAAVIGILCPIIWWILVFRTDTDYTYEDDGEVEEG